MAVQTIRRLRADYDATNRAIAQDVLRIPGRYPWLVEWARLVLTRATDRRGE